ncbi:hypothetical protein GBAR_LOCUS18672, partial [Geodia barretti]
MTPERVVGDRNIFWRVEEERGRGGVVTHYIRLATSPQHASTFFIRPDCRKMGKYFFITTYDTNGSKCTEDQRRQSRCSEQPVPHEPATALEYETDGGMLSSPVSPPGDANEFPHIVTSRGGNYGNRRHGDGGPGMMHHLGDSTKGISSNVERYVHVSRKTIFKHLPTSTRIKIKAKAAVRPQFARFQLVDCRDRRDKTLLESDWLPDEREWSGQPFFLRPHYHVTNCLAASWIG